jgi:glyoxylase-like metal-dependent hydrolase (beta-lactamase superfamily II)
MPADAIADHEPAQAVATACDLVARTLNQTPKRPEVMSFFDEPTNTASHVVRDPASRRCAIVDSVLDYDAASGRTATEAAEKIIAFVRDRGLEVEWILETHVHADHLSAAPYIKEKLGGTLGIGENIRVVQDIFGKGFNAGTEFQRDGSQFDHLFADRISIGALDAIALHTPGHTPACMTYVIGDAAFVGDIVFMPDYGTARADFPGGNARTLYRSVRRVLCRPVNGAPAPPTASRTMRSPPPGPDGWSTARSSFPTARRLSVPTASCGSAGVPTRAAVSRRRRTREPTRRSAPPWPTVDRPGT